MDDRSTEGKRAHPEIANPEAAQRVGDAARNRIAASLDSTGKALALLAGLGAFFIGAGYFVEWQRFRPGRLPSEQVLPLMPKDQIAAAGARELAISVLFVGLSLFLLGFVIFRVARWANGRQGRLPRTLNRILSRDIAFPTAVVGGLTLLIVPFGVFGVLVTAILTGLFLYGLLLIRRFLATDGSESFPLWRLAIAVGLAAIVLAGARQYEFPERRPDVLVCLSDGTEFEGDYIASDANKVLIRKRLLADSEKDLFRDAQEEREAAEEKSGAKQEKALRKARRLEARFARKTRGKRPDGLECAASVASHDKATLRKNVVRRQIRKRPRLIVIPTTDVEEILLARIGRPLPYDNSLLGKIASAIPWMPAIKLACIPPECRWRERTRVGPSTFL